MKQKFINIINTDEFYNYCENVNRTLSDRKGSNDVWLTILTTTLKNYKY